MPGTAILDPDVLVDSLITDVIDGLREDLHPQFGVRAFRAFTVLRTWSGRIPGDGAVTEVETEIRPQPLVKEWGGSGLHRTLEPCGLDEAGSVTLAEVSLTYTEAEIMGPALARNQQWFWRLAEAHGQATRTRDFLIDKPPYPDRIKDMGWAVYLRRA